MWPYRYGQSISLIGTWLTRVATSWLVFRLTHSASILGLITFASLIPAFLLTPVAGVLVDRSDKHRVLVITQVCAALQSAALATLTLFGKIMISQLLVLSVFQGFISPRRGGTRGVACVRRIQSVEFSSGVSLCAGAARRRIR